MAQHSTTHTLVYKTVQSTDFFAEVHLPDETKFSHVAAIANQILRSAAGKPQSKEDEDYSLPVVLFFHGGGLVAGVREMKTMASPWLLKDALNAGFCFISADYSLFHPGDGFDIIKDVKDCLAWIAKDLNKLLAQIKTSQLINPDKIVVAGVSAGGYVAYLAAIHGSPKPKAVLPIYAMGGNYLLDHYVVPKTKPFIPSRPLIPSSSASLYAPLLSIPESSPPILSVPFIPSSAPRLDYLEWQLQTATFLEVLTSIPNISSQLASLPYESRLSQLPEEVKALIPAAKVDKSFPPTFFVHGNKDFLVLLEESRSFERVLKEVGVETRFYEHEGGDHAFEIETKDSKEIPGLMKIVPWLLGKVNAK